MKKDDTEARWLGMPIPMVLAMWHTFLTILVGAILTYMAQRNHEVSTTAANKVDAVTVKVEAAATKADEAANKADEAAGRADAVAVETKDSMKQNIKEAQKTVLEAIKTLPDKAAEKVVERVKDM